METGVDDSDAPSAPFSTHIIIASSKAFALRTPPDPPQPTHLTYATYPPSLALLVRREHRRALTTDPTHPTHLTYATYPTYPTYPTHLTYATYPTYATNPALSTISERPPQHLAHHRLRQIGAELDLRRHLVRCQLFAAEGAQIRFGDRLPRAQHDPGLDRFAFGRVGDPGDADLRDCGMRCEHFLDLSRPHLVAALFDQALLAIDDEEIPVVVQVSQIPGMQPAAGGAIQLVIAQHCGCFIGPVPVADHHLRRRDRNLPDLVRGQLARAFVAVEDTDEDVGQRHPDGPELVGPFHRIDRERHHRLGERIALDDATAGDRFEARLRIGQQR